MSKNNITKQDLVIIGAGTSGVMCGLGAINHGLKVTLICNHNADFNTSSLLTETIPSKAFIYCANISHTIKNAANFGLNANLNITDLKKVNKYIKNVIKEFQQDNDLETFERLGGQIIIGNATFINNNSIVVNNLEIHSKFFIIATGTRAVAPNIINLTKQNFVTYRNLFDTHLNINKNIIIMGGRSESLEIAQSLARFGCKVSLIFTQTNLFPLEDQSLIKKLQNNLEKEGIAFYFVNKITDFYWQNKRKILVCHDYRGNQILIDGDEIINLQHGQPNVEDLNLFNIDIKHNEKGIIVNNRLQTTQHNIFALGSVANTPFKSVHLTEHQANIILSNIIFKIPRKVDYKLIPRIIYTDPQLASVGITKIQPSNVNAIKNSIKILKFDLKNIDAAIYQQQPCGEIKVICRNDKILGCSILSPMAAEVINEYTLAMQTGVEISEIAKNIHIYPSISQINKRVAHKNFQANNKHSSGITKTFTKIKQVLNKITFAN